MVFPLDPTSRFGRRDLNKAVINNLTVVGLAPRAGYRHTRWTCECRCGHKINLHACQLMAGKTPRCVKCGATS